MRKIIHATFIATLVLTLVCGVPLAEDMPPRITVAEVRAMLDRGEEITFLDTRRGPDLEASSSKIPDAIRVSNNEELAKAVKNLPRNGKIVTYCA